MDQRLEFVTRSLNCQHFGELCREYGISRKTGYKWRDRFPNGGHAGLEELSRKPKGHAEALAEEAVCEIVRLKQARPAWGPVKICELYRRRRPGAPPSESTFKRVLARAGLAEARKRRPAHEAGRLASGHKAQPPNKVWTVDLKGWWHGPDKAKVEPLTVRDEFSRMILELRAMEARRVNAKGMICFRREQTFLSESPGGWDVGLAPIEDGLVEVRFANLLLGRLEPRTASFRPFVNGAGVIATAKAVKTRKSSPAGRGFACDKPEVSGLSCNLKTNPNV